MKGNLMSSLVQLDNETMQQLVAEVKETIAKEMDFVKGEKASFKAIDFWKMERSRKSATNTFSRKRNEIPFI